MLRIFIPQGSILGPLRCLIYIKYLLQSLSVSCSYLFVGDTCIFCQGKDIQEIEDALTKEFSTLCE